MTSAARLLLLDFSGVLFRDAMGSIQTEIATAAGADRRRLGDFYEARLRDELWRGTISERRFWCELLTHAGLPVQPDRWRQRLLDGTVALPACARLANWAAVAQVALLSNQRTEWVEAALRRENVLAPFDRLHVSDRVGYLKPEPEIYGAALAPWSGTRSSVLFVDDEPTYLKAASEWEIQTLAADSGGRWCDAVDRWLGA